MRKMSSLLFSPTNGSLVLSPFLMTGYCLLMRASQNESIQVVSVNWMVVVVNMYTDIEDQDSLGC